MFDMISEHHIKSGGIKTIENIPDIKYIKEDENIVYTTSLFPDCIIKTGNPRDILSEYFIGNWGINDIRHKCDGLVYVLGMFKSNVMKTPYKKYYVSENSMSLVPKGFPENLIHKLNGEMYHIIYERTEGVELYNFIKSLKTRKQLHQLEKYMIVVVLILAYALQHKNFIHNDLHLNNIILRPWFKDFVIRIYNTEYTIYLDYLPTFIDWGLSSITYDNITLSNASFEEYNISSFTTHYNYDLHKFILAVLSYTLTLNTEFYSELNWILDFYKSDIGENIFNKKDDIDYMRIWFGDEMKNLFRDTSRSKIEISPINLLNWIVNHSNSFKSHFKTSVNTTIINPFIDKHQNYLHKLNYYQKCNIQSIKNINLTCNISTYDIDYWNYLNEIKYPNKKFIEFHTQLQSADSRKKFDNPSNSFLTTLKSELNDLLLELNNLDVYHIINSYNRLYTKYFKAIYTLDLAQYYEYKVLFEYIFRSINSYILDTPTSEKEKSSHLYFFINYCKVLSNDIYNNQLIVDSYNMFEKDCYKTFSKLNSYIPPSVDKQIYICFLKNKKNLFDLLYKHFNLKNKLIINEYSSDIQTYDLLKKYRKVYPPDTTNYRGKKRVSEISEYLNLITSGRDLSGREPSYLDFGGGDGSISVEISKALQVKPDNSYCGDIIQWENKLRLMPYSDILTYINIKPYMSLDFDDNSLDFITAFQVFHHILDIDFVLSELYRVLKKGGYMLIREHDSETVYDSMLMDIEHSIYEYVYDNNTTFLQYYYAYYKNRKEWRSKLESVGFKRVNISDKNHMNKNPTKYYFEMYTKH